LNINSVSKSNSNSIYSPSLSRQNGGRKKTKKERPKSHITVTPPQSRRPGLSPVSISSRIPIELSPPLDPVSLRSLNIGRVENNSDASNSRQSESSDSDNLSNDFFNTDIRFSDEFFGLGTDSSNFDNLPYNRDNLLSGLDDLLAGLLVKKKRKTDDKISLNEQRPRKKEKRKRGPYAKKIQEDLRLWGEWKKMPRAEREKLSDPDKANYRKVRKRVATRKYEQRKRDGIRTLRGPGVASTPAKIQEDLRLSNEWKVMSKSKKDKLTPEKKNEYKKAYQSVASRAYAQRQRDGIRTPRGQGVASTPAEIQEDLRLWDEWEEMSRSVRKKLSGPDKEKYRKVRTRVSSRKYEQRQRQASKLGKRKRELAASILTPLKK